MGSRGDCVCLCVPPPNCLQDLGHDPESWLPHLSNGCVSFLAAVTDDHECISLKRHVLIISCKLYVLEDRGQKWVFLG